MFEFSVDGAYIRCVLKTPLVLQVRPSLPSFLSSYLTCTSASRALETVRKDALVRDPLARHFSPFKPEESTESVAASPSSQRTVSYTIIRTRYFDDALTAALNSETKQHSLFSELNAFLETQTGDLCEQVVSVGSGFDSRPWRLPETSVHWFEVDSRRLLKNKIRLLKSAKASLQFQENEDCQFPLQCFSHTFVAANVHHPNWVNRVLRAGLRGTMCTLWVLEGLLLRLDPKSVSTVLHRLAELSPPGSLLMASVVSESEVENNTSQDANWKWGCPENAEEFFASVGWKTLSLISWTDVAYSYGCKPRKKRALKDPARFLIATKA